MSNITITHPEIAAQWHPTKNIGLHPENFTKGSDEKVSWKCPVADDHEWKTRISHRTSGGSGCPCCSGRKIVGSNCLATTHPELAEQWHPTRNSKTVFQVGAGTSKQYSWKCPVADDHEWEESINNRARKLYGCPCCSGQKIVGSNCLATTHPELAEQWHPTRNSKTAHEVVAGSDEKVWWKCPKGNDHEWPAIINNRSKKGQGCAVCAKRRVVKSTSLAFNYPEITAEWHPTKNDELKPEDIVDTSSVDIWWQCLKDSSHPPWQATVVKRTKYNQGCSACNLGWTVENVKIFIRSILPVIDLLLPVELYVLYQQSGLFGARGKSTNFINLLKTGRFPKEEIEKFANNQPSTIDELMNQNVDANSKEIGEELIKNSLPMDDINIELEDNLLPVVQTQDVLSSLDNKIISNFDGEVIEFFINSALAKIWKHVFLNEAQAIMQLRNYEAGKYANEVKNRFLDQYNGAVNLIIPSGYSFHSQPNLMQKYTAYLLGARKRLGNWSGTGSGKTLSAILSSRVINSRITLICCPNSVVSGWKDAIKNTYPDSFIFEKTLNTTLENENNIPCYLILNYEFFQQSQAEKKLKNFIKNNKIDFVVIDEIHYSKQRVVENISKRKKVVSAMLAEAFNQNANLHVLGMSATPVINNLFEGKTLIELITGVSHNDLNTAATVSNCISLYQKLVLHGIRWVPQYSQKLSLQPIEIDCSDWIENIKKLGLKSTMVDLEGVLTLAKIPIILNNIKPKTIVYTHFLKNIILPLKNAIEFNGWRVAIYSGDDKTGLENFISGNSDVLIATSCISTGVDGLQSVCNRIIINALPWTHAEFEQLKGRVYRQGQIQEHVDIIIPLTYAHINGERWSWCDSRWKRIQFKKSISDAAVDGVIPEGQLRTPAQAYQDAINWLSRLENGQVKEIKREIISLSLSEEEFISGYRKYGDFSQMNRLLNTTSSSVMHEKLNQDPSWWESYHALYRHARKEWLVIPVEEAIKWCKLHPYFVVGDFGCGEAILADSLDNIVYSFDHVAINDNVISCDMSHVPLEDASLDAAIFSLSLMGTNYVDYLKEAYRCLKLDGQLWIAETTSRFENLNLLKDNISSIGFNVFSIQQKGSFTFLRALKE